jgi:hypothetical protein
MNLITRQMSASQNAERASITDRRNELGRIEQCWHSAEGNRVFNTENIADTSTKHLALPGNVDFDLCILAENAGGRKGHRKVSVWRSNALQ